MKLLKETIIAELQPIKNDISEIKDLNKKALSRTDDRFTN